MKTALARIAFKAIEIGGLVLRGVMWVIKPFVMLWQQVRDAVRRKSA